MTWTSDLPILTTLLIAAVAAFFLYRHGGGTALEGLERANGILEKRVRSLEVENKALHAEVGELRARTDIVEAMKPLVTALTQHDQWSSARAQDMIVLLELIAKRLGPDPD